MRPLILSLLCGLTICSVSLLQPCRADDGHDHDGGEHRHAVPQQYFVTLSVYEVPGIESPEMKPGDVLKFIESNKLKPAQTIRLSTSSETESTVQFAKRVSVSTGQTFSRGVSTKQNQFMDVGTIIRIVTSASDSGVDAKISFESSAVQTTEDPDGPPNVGTTSLETQLHFQFDKPVLLGGASGGDNTQLVMSISSLN